MARLGNIVVRNNQRALRRMVAAKNITPETYPETFVSKVPAQNIIECTAGCADFYQFTLGEQLSIVRE